jgi:hypothetical protein
LIINGPRRLSIVRAFINRFETVIIYIVMRQEFITRRQTPGKFQCDKRSTLGWATLVTAMQVTFCLTRVPARTTGALPVAAAITSLPHTPARPVRRTTQSASRPIHTYCIGRICIASGMAVIALAFWLQIMHVSRWIGW